MKIAVAQINSHIGNIELNKENILKEIDIAVQKEMDLIIFPEFAISGAPLYDLVKSESFVDKCYAALEDIAVHNTAIDILIGMPTQSGEDFFSSIIYIVEGEVANVFTKAMIDSRSEKNFLSGIDSPDYNDEGNMDDIDDENEIPMNIINFRGEKALVVTGDDIDYLETIDKSLRVNFVISIKSPIYEKDSIVDEYEVVAEAAGEFKRPIIRCSAAGGNAASFINFGGSCVASATGQIVTTGKCFASDTFYVDTNDISKKKPVAKGIMSRENVKDNYNALVLAVSDFFAKQGLNKAVLGLSGGIDSAVVLAVAADALGKENVAVMMMPSQFSSKESVDDSVVMAERLGVEKFEVNISQMYDATIASLSPIFKDLPFSVAEENIQSRLRGLLLMAYSNKFGNILLNTTNKSECAVGYGTIYGDTNGSLSILADLYKEEVYDLAAYINRDTDVIPTSIIDKAPSAELRPDQKDSDSLPEYPELDAILYMLIEENRSVLDVVAAGHDVDVVSKIHKLIASSEHKRYQLPPIVKLSSATFGIDLIKPIGSKLI